MITLEHIRKAKQDKRAVDAVNALSNYVNGSYSDRDFCVLMTQEHRTLQQSMTSLMISWFYQLVENQKERLTDGRNEAAANAAKVIVDALESAGIGKYLPYI